MEQTQIEQIQNLENQSNQNRKANKKLLLIAVSALILVSAGGVFLFKDKIFPPVSEIENKESQQEEFIEEEKENNNSPEENDAERKSDLNEIRTMLEMYYDDNNQYPISYDIVKLNNESSSVRKELLKYINEASIKDPRDPEFYYGYKSDGNYYELTVRLENLEDEECELLNSDLCIYKVDSDGGVSKKKRKVFVGDYEFKVKTFSILSTLESKSPQDDIITVVDDIYTDSFLEDTNKYSSNLKIKRASEITEDEIASNNLIIIGSRINDLTIKIYKKISLATLTDIINEDEIKMVIKASINPWNVEKIIAFGEKNYLKGPTIGFRGRISVQKKGDFYHIVFNTDNNESYALVPSSILSKSNRLIDFDNQYVEISGYKRICNSKEFPIEDSIGVTSIKIIE